MKTRIMKCSKCGVKIERSIRTSPKVAKCEKCLAETKRECSRRFRVKEKERKRELKLSDSKKISLWATKSELKFISGLTKNVARKYAVALENRVFWGDLDKKECKEACRKQAGLGGM